MRLFKAHCVILITTKQKSSCMCAIKLTLFSVSDANVRLSHSMIKDTFLSHR